MPFAVPTSLVQIWTFSASGLVFFLFLIRAATGRSAETGGKRDRRSRLGIIVQGIGFGITAFGPVRPVLAALSPASIAGTAAVLLFMSGAIGLFAASSRALGRNWSLVARMRTDHELVRTGPYARVRHPIYLGMLFFLLALATALGHWAQLILGLPIFIAGTLIRTQLEDGLLEQQFGETFRDYRSSTPALIPKL